ncbi:HopJ type III effector protein [Marinomonas spartinae]|uniref:HopJ type III effector protein n=1 Tax=Marinomonas spartinae TaxID=1792290 RepID=A0A1A8TBF4_9GAMM|nr:HopJ type III effector protein [Marinomonas spartinae]SBS30287.1 HopJ type III effector protein [Marinomonas spartinae]SBS36782.1 HopJ type III effector protein [Marinomonas spartinae]
MLTTDSILEQVKSTPDQVQFKEVISVIENEYNFTATSFTNGQLVNGLNENNGSCKIFYFAQLHQLSPEETLPLFGHFYRIDVLENPEGTDHQNIRQFMQHGWDGIAFDGVALSKKAE